MDIKELVECKAEQLYTKYKFFLNGVKWAEWYDKEAWREDAREILSHPDLALVIRDGDEVPLGVEIETHHVVLLKKALKEVSNE